MANPELLNYLKQFLATGQGTEAARKTLLGVGWSEADINEGIKELESQSQVQAPVGGLPVQTSGGVPQEMVLGAEPGPKKRLTMPVLAATVVAVLFLGGGAYAYFGLGIGASPPPEKVLSEAINNLWNIKTLNATSHFEVGYNGQFLEGGKFLAGSGVDAEKLLKDQPKGDASAALSIDSSGEADISDLTKQRVSTKLDLGVKFPGIAKIVIKSDFVMIDNVIYVKLNNVEDWKVLVSQFLDASSLEGKWIKFDAREFGPVMGGLGWPNFLAGNFSSVAPSKPNLELGQVMNSIDSILPIVPQFSVEYEEKLKELFTKYKVFIVKEKLPDEAIEGNKTYHYRLTLDRESVKSFAADYLNFSQAAIVKQMGVKASDLKGAEQTAVQSKAEVGKAKAEMDKFFAEAEKFLQEHVNVSSSDVWIGKSDKRIRQIKLDFTLKHDVLGGEVHVVTGGTYSKINEPVAVEAPKEAMSVEEVMAQLEQSPGNASFFGQSQDSTRTADLFTFKSALALYLADVASPKLCENRNTIYASAPIKVPPGWVLGKNSGSREVNGTGWIPVNLTEISSGAPIARLFVDPRNDPSKKLVYLYACDPKSFTFELDTILQSDKFSPQMATDGGDDPKVFEVGTSPGLKLIPKGFWNNNF
ncbi:MAG: hypothetical protein HY093_04550 [Candidatus Liptonbacteria bacterium]|nr:hypothetical protein [Candidatus Liptonbacteria bacterium]